MIARIPIRLRLTVGFTIVMAVVLAATGIFVYVRLVSALDATVNSGLRSRAQDVASLVQQSESGLSEAASTGVIEHGESYAQVVSRSGAVIDSTADLGATRLLDRAQLARAYRRPVVAELGPVGATDGSSRILAIPVSAQDSRLVVVVGTSLEPRNEAISSLRTQLLIGGPFALLLASLAGYFLAAAALRPVASMRRRAARVTGADGSERLPIPPARDEIRDLAETLNGMLKRIESTVKRERQFTADASHEIRTPLALLRAELELAQWPGRTRVEIDAAVRSASDEADRLAQLAEDLLVLARADDGRVPVRLQAMAVADALDLVATRFTARAALAGRTIAVEPSPFTLEADPLRLGQALGNLVDNAMRHGDGRVRLSVRRAPGQVEIHVEDEGAGFPPEYLPYAFDRFTRASAARERGGAGLGLAIVEVVARAHGGSAHAINRPGGGVDAWVSLPSIEA